MYAVLVLCAVAANPPQAPLLITTLAQAPPLLCDEGQNRPEGEGWVWSEKGYWYRRVPPPVPGSGVMDEAGLRRMIDNTPRFAPVYIAPPIRPVVYGSTSPRFTYTATPPRSTAYGNAAYCVGGG